MDRFLKLLFLALGVVLTIFELYESGFGGEFTPLVVRATHVGLVLALIFLAYDWRGGKRFGGPHSRNAASDAGDLLLAMASLAVCVYAIVNSHRFLFEISSFPSRVRTADLVAATILLLLILEASRRAASISFSLITGAVILYAMFGDRAPGVIAINPYTFNEILTQLYTTTVGFWGDITGVSAVEIAVLVLFAGMLTGVGGLDFLRDIAMVIAGRATGGAGKVAVIMSALFGMISGSSAANVASVGSFTIPMMIQQSYRREFAGGLEAASSTFGQLMPPIMGTGAFIMAELLGVSYARVMAAAVIPTVAIYAGIYFATHFYAKRDGISGLPDDLIAAARRRLTTRGAVQLLVPLVVLIGLLIIGYSVPNAAFYAYVTTLAIYLVQNWRQPAMTLLVRVRDAVMGGVTSLLAVAVLIFAAQTLVTLINMTSLGVTFTTLVTGSNVPPFAFVLLAAFATLVLGMGLPTTGAYVVAASVTIPPMLAYGFTALSAHMFVFFFAILSAITPPVCVAVYVGAAIAQANWLKVAAECMRISVMKFILPFLMLYNVALLFDGSLVLTLLSTIAVLLLSFATESLFFFQMFKRLSLAEFALGVVAVLLLVASLGLWTFDTSAGRLACGIVGALLVGTMMASNYWRRPLAVRLQT